MLDRDQRRSTEVRGQYFEQYVHHWGVGLVVDGVIDVARFEEEVAWSVDDYLFRQDIRHIAGRHLPDAGTDMIVLADMTAGSKCQLGDAKLVFSIDLGEEAPERRLELDLRNQALGIDLHRTGACLRRRFAGPRHQRQERQSGESLKNVAPDVFVTGHANLLLRAHRWWIMGSACQATSPGIGLPCRSEPV